MKDFFRWRGNTPLCNMWVPFAIIATFIAMTFHPRETWKSIWEGEQ